MEKSNPTPWLPKWTGCNHVCWPPYSDHMADADTRSAD